MKKILILHTGGTFGMTIEQEHAVIDNSAHFLKGLLQYVPELTSLAEIKVKILCNIDSSNATSALWIDIANAICECWNDFDGFVVIHGTDTMAWSTSALAYFLEGLTKSVVFTGSQRPLAALRNDARANIIDSVELATYGIPEVMLCFDSKVHRATRVTKYSNEHLYAFKSYNSPLIGRFGVNFKLNKKIAQSILPEIKRHPPSLNMALNSNITSLICVPSVKLSQEFMTSILKTSLGIIIQGFGTGNLPTDNESWHKLCEDAYNQQIPVIMSTQCDSGYVSLDLYENGKIYADLGVISALDMTFEAASVKLMIMLGRSIAFEKRHEFFSTPLAFECSSTTYTTSNKSLEVN